MKFSATALLCSTAAVAASAAEPLPTDGFAAQLRAAVGDRIKHVIVLMEENRSFDHFFGFAAKLLGVNGVKGDETQLKNLSDPSQGSVTIDSHSPYCGLCDPDHGTPATTSKIYGLGNASAGDPPTMGGFVDFENSKDHAHLDYCGVMSMFEPSGIPVITALAQEFAVMDRFFCSHPGPTWPNRMYALSGTSASSTSTGTWFNNTPGNLFPQRTIFDQVAAAGLETRNYYKDTPWEMFMSSVAHHPERQANMDTFFADAASGNLPAFAWINPRSGVNVTTGEGSNDQHPDHDVALGEQLFKDIYEALRAGPAWNDTLFIITMDEHGGFWDHVPPPAGVPPPSKDMLPSYPDAGFTFDRLGVRIPTILVSPWIPKGTVISAPPDAQKPQPNSEYDLTSIMATTRLLLGMPTTPLTDRDAWAATFEHALADLPAPRTDCPTHLPDAPPPSLDSHVEAVLPINDLQRDISFLHAHLSGASGQADHAAKTHTAVPQTQGQISEWMQRRYAVHAAAARFNITCDVRSRVGGWTEDEWHYNATTHTISTEQLRSPSGSPYCLTAGVDGQSVFASYCVSTERINDAQQGWSIADDATVRATNAQWTRQPAAGSATATEPLCLTTGDPVAVDPSTAVFLAPCEKDSVVQHFAFHGPNSKDGGAGAIMFGDAANYLGIV